MRVAQIYQIVLMLVLILTAQRCDKVHGIQDRQAKALSNLRAHSKNPLKVHFEGGIPRFVTLQVPMPKNAPDDPVVRALNFLELYRDLYHIENPRAQLYLDHSVANETGQHIFLANASMTCQFSERS